MDDSSFAKTTVAVDPRHVGYAQIMYALHALAILTGLLTAASVVGNFVFSVPSIIAVVMNYARRNQVRGTWLESHFRWQLRTFWIALAVFIIARLALWPLILVLGGWPLLFTCFMIGAWVTWRIARGWIALSNQRPLPVN